MELVLHPIVMRTLLLMVVMVTMADHVTTASIAICHHSPPTSTSGRAGHRARRPMVVVHGHSATRLIQGGG